MQKCREIQCFTIKTYIIMSDLSMMLLSLGMAIFFIGPFVIISVIKKREEAQRKQKEK